MKPVVWLFILFIVASGLSAWIGNDWGRRIGKRKLTVFSLRPKHTSTFLTILLSMCLSLGFLGAYLLLDKDAREALLQPEVREEREYQVVQQQMSQFSSTLQQLQNRDSADATSSVKLAVKPQTDKSGLKGNSAAPARAAQAPVNVAVKPAAPMRLASRPLQTQTRTSPSENDDWAAEDAAEVQPERLVLQPARRPQAPQSQPASRQQSVPVAPRNRPEARVAEPESSAGTWQPSSKPVQVAMLAEPVFELRVYGGRSPVESEQIVEGVLDMTRAYAEQLGLEPGTGPLLQVQQANLSQSQRALEKEQIYQLQVQIGKVSTASQSLPVKIVMAPAAGDAGFDPHQLLEDARLNPDGGSGSLQEDLQLAILNLAREARAELQLAPLEAPHDVHYAAGELPFTVVKLRRSGGTLQGHLVMSADSANLTEN